jgi:hypothetical protein
VNLCRTDSTDLGDKWQADLLRIEKVITFQNKNAELRSYTQGRSNSLLSFNTTWSA